MMISANSLRALTAPVPTRSNITGFPQILCLFPYHNSPPAPPFYLPERLALQRREVNFHSRNGHKTERLHVWRSGSDAKYAYSQFTPETSLGRAAVSAGNNCWGLWLPLFGKKAMPNKSIEWRYVYKGATHLK